MSCRGTNRIAGLALALSLLATPAVAQEHFDVLLYEDSSGDVGTALVDVDTAGVTPGQVIEGELLGDTLSVSPTFTGEGPGFFSFSDTAVAGGPPGFPAGADNLTGSSQVSLDFLVEPTLGLSLAFWNDGLGQWEAPGVGDSIMMSTLLDPGGSIDGTSEIIDMVLATTSGSGSMDDHPDYELSNGSPTGVYLAYGQASVAGYADPSMPFWIVFGTLDECEETDSCNAAQELFNEGIEDQIDAAIGYTEANLVPEPGTGLLLAFGLGGMALRRRGKQE
ncbi:MAG: PEP-CTERM sorting domain-containing protein [Myxococcota bacterium]